MADRSSFVWFEYSANTYLTFGKQIAANDLRVRSVVKAFAALYAVAGPEK